MAIIRESYLVFIEINTEKARNFPCGFDDAETNFGLIGFNEDSYPNWDLNYLGCETEFIKMMWREFETSFKYDGLLCQITRVRNNA